MKDDIDKMVNGTIDIGVGIVVRATIFLIVVLSVISCQMRLRELESRPLPVQVIPTYHAE